MVYILHDAESRPLAAFFDPEAFHSAEFVPFALSAARKGSGKGVVLPTPLGPVIATTSPGRAEKRQVPEHRSAFAEAAG